MAWCLKTLLIQETLSNLSNFGYQCYKEFFWDTRFVERYSIRAMSFISAMSLITYPRQLM
jgi:hypothetical protein